MKMKVFTTLAALSFSIFLTGCVSTVDGHSKMGVPLMKDSIQSRYERSKATMVTATKAVLGNIGTVTAQDVINNVITAKVDTRTVWVKIFEVEPRLSALIVQARSKGGAPDVDLASEVDKQIALYLASHP
jgi:hypothetical protein